MNCINKFYDKIMYILFLFFVSSLIGGMLESFYVWFLFNKFNIGGFMYGPWRPIYGFGCLLLYFITKNLKNDNLKIFLNSLFWCSLFEYFSSWILEVIFNKTWWDYSANFLNINGRVCLFNSIIWGALGLIFVNYIEPFFYNIFKKVDLNKMNILIYFFLVLFQMDLIVSIIKHIS